MNSKDVTDVTDKSSHPRIHDQAFLLFTRIIINYFFARIQNQLLSENLLRIEFQMKNKKVIEKYIKEELKFERTSTWLNDHPKASRTEVIDFISNILEDEELRKVTDSIALQEPFQKRKSQLVPNRNQTYSLLTGGICSVSVGLLANEDKTFWCGIGFILGFLGSYCLFEKEIPKEDWNSLFESISEDIQQYSEKELESLARATRTLVLIL